MELGLRIPIDQESGQFSTMLLSKAIVGFAAFLEIWAYTPTIFMITDGAKIEVVLWIPADNQ
jgi:hypothetical protein